MPKELNDKLKERDERGKDIKKKERDLERPETPTSDEEMNSIKNEKANESKKTGKPEDTKTEKCASKVEASKGDKNTVKHEGSKAGKDARKDEDFKEKYTRLSADFQNFKRRTEEERSQIYLRANERIILELLGVLDNFERAIATECTDATFLEGIQAIKKQLDTILQSEGVTEIEATGKEFDPKFHNAVITETAEGFDSGQIIEVLQKGYMIKDRVIRPAMVKVAS
ncbi:MAG: nucleotide exchange factor GrpE [Enterococcus sp.]|nr:nucleotide exchange factor GrpE [Enterococcus sp.]